MAGDMYDSEDLEEYDPLEMARAAYVEDYNFDVPEGMDLMTYTRRRPYGGETFFSGCSPPPFFSDCSQDFHESPDYV